MNVNIKFFYRVVFAVFFMVAVTAIETHAASAPEKIIGDTLSMLSEISSQPDVEGMAKTLRSAHAVALVPSMIKAGVILGGEYGPGLIMVRKNGKWFGPGFYNLSGGSLGFQFGAQKISLLLAVINERGVGAFMKNKTELGGDVSIAAGPVGRHAEAATDAQAKASIYSYSMTKGLFAGISLQGAVISISVKRNSEYWGRKISAAEALQQPATDKRILPLVNALDELIKKAK